MGRRIRPESLLHSASLWQDMKVGPYAFHLLDLDHPDVEGAILDEIDSGIDVYYDCRWGMTEVFCKFLLDHPEWVAGRSVGVIGAGVGAESLVIGRLAKKMIINDWAPVALELCALQLTKNGIQHYELLPGRYEEIRVPPVDIVVGCFLIYNTETARAMNRFLDLCPFPVLLMNEPLPPFKKFLRTAARRRRTLLADEMSTCILFE